MSIEEPPGEWPEPEFETVTVEVEWRSSFTLRVPREARTPPTLDELMDLVQADPDTGGDFDAAGAEVVDWTIRRR